MPFGSFRQITRHTVDQFLRVDVLVDRFEDVALRQLGDGRFDLRVEVESPSGVEGVREERSQLAVVAALLLFTLEPALLRLGQLPIGDPLLEQQREFFMRQRDDLFDVLRIRDPVLRQRCTGVPVSPIKRLIDHCLNEYRELSIHCDQFEMLRT